MSEFILAKKHIQLPVDFVESYLAEANGAYVKVYLYILSLASRGAPLGNADIARKLGLTESDVLNAFDYWKELGVITESGNSVIIGVGGAAPAATATESGARPVYDSLQVSTSIQANTALSDMIQLAQEIFGRILSNTEMETLYWFYDGLGFSAEAILLLLEFCVSKGKSNIKYIEKVALSWHEQGATNADKVVEIVKEDESKNGYIHSIRRIMGISDRSLSQSEEQYLTKWRNEKGMNEEMVVLAYEYCIMQTAKLSFPYMDKIIERWFNQGIKDIAAAEEDNRRFRAKVSSMKPEQTDYSDLEDLTRKRTQD